MKSGLVLLSVIFLFSFSTAASASGSRPILLEEIIPPDRRIDWKYAGIPGGIPERNVICETIDSNQYGDGMTDATSAIQSALNDCPNDQVVYLPAGTYIVTNAIHMGDHEVLRGAGPGLTILKHIGSNPGGIDVQNNIWTALIGSPRIRNITKAVKDEQVITLDNTEGISPGDILLLNQRNDGVNVDPYGTSGTKCTYCGLSNGDRSLGQFVEVSSVNGDHVSLKQPLHWTYNTSLTPWAYIVPGSYITRWSGIEDLTLTQDTPTVAYLIFLQGVQYFWVKNVEISNVYIGGIQTYYAMQSEFTSNYIHYASNVNAGAGYGFVITMYSSNNRVENNILDTLSGGLDTHGGASGNVIAYNYLHNIIYATPWWLVGSPILNHGAHPKMNLWEGNVGYKLAADFINGSSSHNTIYRSLSKGWMNEQTTTRNNATEIAKKNYYYNFVGNVLGTEGKSNIYQVDPSNYSSYNQLTDMAIWALGVENGVKDTRVAETLYRHGNFDYVNNGVADWDPNIADHDLPTSLYLNEPPDWWCHETPWPGIGPDVDGLANEIPAQRRFEELPCLRYDALTFTGVARNHTAVLEWEVDGVLPPSTTWTIEYVGPPGDQPSPITGLPTDTRFATITGLSNNTWYTITLKTDPPLLTETISLFTTAHILNLPVIIQ